MTVKTAAAYIRVSDARQDEYSPASQLKLIRDYAAKNGYMVPEEYVFYDDGISGASAKKRTQFNVMLGFAKQKNPPFTAILVWKFSRFARNQEESIVFKNLLKKNGVSVISVSEPISDDPFGGLIERIIEWMDEYYLIRLGPEVRRGMIEKVSRGEPVYHPPFGYIFDHNLKRFAPDPEKAPVVVDIFESFVRGEGMQHIARRLNAAGVRSARGNPLDNRGIEYILHNPTYIGKLRWSENGKKASVRDFSPEGCIIVDGEHQPLISQALWDQAQARADEIKSKYGRYQRAEQPVEYMLKGLLRCSDCGATLVRVHAQTPALQCHNYARGACKHSHYISIAKADAAVADALRLAVSGDPRAITPPAPSAADASGAALAELEKQIAAALKKLDRLSDGYLNGVFDLDQFKRLKSAIDAELADLQQKKEAAAAAPNLTFDPDRFRARLQSVLDTISDPSVPESSKASALRSVVSSITFDRASTSFDLHLYY